ncbi:MAG: hypothetical protein M3O82_05770 [Verrucomicrobiota bacterium]|nr:hypothetical protein [Verrucomicrobiota bacterium]
MFTFPRRKGWLIFAGAVGSALIVVACAMAYFNPRLTRYVESEQFQAELEKETRKACIFQRDVTPRSGVPVSCLRRAMVFMRKTVGKR